MSAPSSPAPPPRRRRPLDPPPGGVARRHPRWVIATRLAVALWLLLVTVLVATSTLWGLCILIAVALDLYLAWRTAVVRREDDAGG